MYCSNCGKQNFGETPLCSSCGWVMCWKTKTLSNEYLARQDRYAHIAAIGSLVCFFIPVALIIECAMLFSAGFVPPFFDYIPTNFLLSAFSVFAPWSVIHLAFLCGVTGTGLAVWAVCKSSSAKGLWGLVLNIPLLLASLLLEGGYWFFRLHCERSAAAPEKVRAFLLPLYKANIS